MSPVSLGTVDSFVAALLDEMLIIHDDVCIISLAAERTCRSRTRIMSVLWETTHFLTLRLFETLQAR